MNSVKDSRLTAAMPEMVVYIKVLVLGFIGSEVLRCSYQIGEPLAVQLRAISDVWSLLLQIFFAVLVLVYASSRGAWGAAGRLCRSMRVDLLITLGIGAACDWFLIDSIAVDYLKNLHANGWGWAAAILLFSALLMVTSLVSLGWSKLRRNESQLYFMTDKEIDSPDRDFLSVGDDARTFAKTVIASNTESGLVFGLEGPWGVGKTSFLKLAQAHWDLEVPAPIVFRFEPLRYAGEADLTERFIKELLTVVQSTIFAPEFEVALLRYSKMLKGKAEFSLFGLKMSLEPTSETVDQLLSDVDSVLRRANRRLIVIVEDLDRIEPKAVSNVLFTVRRTFALSRATYVLCYDTENLIAGKDEGALSREFLEKFINVKFSILLDSRLIIKYLKEGWKKEDDFVRALTSDRAPVLGELLADLAILLEGENTVPYMRLVGNLRKVKRFINAVVSMQLERLDISITDFNRGDIINLVLLHMNYPGLFRQIFAEETEGRSGIFSSLVRADNNIQNNSPEYLECVSAQDAGGVFLLDSLFSTRVRRVESGRARAFVNDRYDRSLEKYLELIVRRVVPDPTQTLKLYQQSVSKAVKGGATEEILAGRGFELSEGERAHQRFWELFIDKCNDDRGLAASAADALIDFIPRYMMLRVSGENLRHRSILHVAKLLDALAWNYSRNGKSGPDPEVANKIFGEEEYAGFGILERMLNPERGVFKWHDVLMFRQYCSPEKSNRYGGVYSSLCQHRSRFSGSVSDVARECLRLISQYVFGRFYDEFIQAQLNLFDEILQVSSQCFWGEVKVAHLAETLGASTLTLDQRVEAEKNYLMSFIVYNMTNASPSDGHVRGCGFYDVQGGEDGNNIALLMNDYLFGFCFDVSRNNRNLLHFLDFCIYNFPYTVHIGEKSASKETQVGSLPMPNEVILSLAHSRLATYWHQHRDEVLSGEYIRMEHSVCTHDNVKSYKDDLKAVCDALDTFCQAEVLAPPQSPVT
ncbi:P-loop NTPase fold protein [Pseudomonas antarctica]|uniref:P-loop NTPase fold protein n=1 Tax=Pseudomonas antarctica TaxID=219572 RepID=UPI0039C13716